MKRLLAVSWEMPPIYGPRATQVARALGALSARGWTSTVICLAPKPGGAYAAAGTAAVPLDGVDLIRVPSPEESWALRALWRLAPSLRYRPDSAHVWIERAVRAATRAAAGAAGLITFGQPWSDHLVGLRVHRQSALPWVAHFSDPWVDSPYGPADAGIRARWRRMEADVVREADAVVFVTTQTADLVMGKYPAEWRAKVSIVPHGFATSVPAATSVPGRTSVPHRDPGPMRIVYTGRFYTGVRTPSGLLRALARIHGRAPLDGVVQFAFVGPFVEEFRSEAESLHVSSLVRFEPRVAANQAAQYAAAADVLLVIDAPSEGPSVFLPSKLVDYLPLRKPILGLTPPVGASADLLRRLGCPVAAPDDVEGIAAVLNEVIGSWRAGTLRIGPHYDTVAAEYEIGRTAAQLDAVLTSACERRRH